MKNTKTKHTQGPWEVSFDKSPIFKICAKDDKRNAQNKRLIIAAVYYEEAWQDSFVANMGRKAEEVRRTKEQAEANAKLIVAAPDMLKALLIMQERIKAVAMAGSDMTYADFYKLLYGNNEVNNAIEKATK